MGAAQRRSRKRGGDISYVALRFDVEANVADAWSDGLLEAGAMSVEAADPRAGTVLESAVFDEPGSDLRWWPTCRLTALLAAGADAQAVMRETAQRLETAVPSYETFTVADQDWVRMTQAQFQPIRIEDDLWIVPTWCSPPRADAVNVTLDPGLAFGTGAHPTTRLCLSWLRANVTAACTVLDYGCGSGILAIAASLLGARRVTGTDIDPQAIGASAANARRNGVKATFVPVDALPMEPFDIVVSNILANPLRVLAPALAARTAANGAIALAGILAAQADDVRGAYSRWFDMRTWRCDDGWVLLAGTRRTSH